jgi:hypothetical protein
MRFLSVVLLLLQAPVTPTPKAAAKVTNKAYTITCTMTLSIPTTGNPTTTNAICTAVPK